MFVNQFENYLTKKEVGQITFFTLTVVMILFILFGAFTPVIDTFVGFVTANSGVSENTRIVWGLIPTFMALALIGTIFVFAGRRQA